MQAQIEIEITLLLFHLGRMTGKKKWRAHIKKGKEKKKEQRTRPVLDEADLCSCSVPSGLMTGVVPLGVELLVWEREELRGCTVLSWDDREWRDEMNEMNESDESARPVRPSRPFRPSQPIYRLAFFWSSRRSVS